MRRQTHPPQRGYGQRPHRLSGTLGTPDGHAHEFTGLDYWVRLARTLERGRFDAVFFTDMLGLYDVCQGNPAPALTGAIQVPIHEPTYLVPAMAEVTEHLGFTAGTKLG